MTTPVYIKFDAHDQLLLSGVCRQLGIITYHPSAEPWRGGRKSAEHQPTKPTEENVNVPRITIRLISSLRILPQKGVVIPVHVDKVTRDSSSVPLAFEADRTLYDSSKIHVQDSIICSDDNGIAYLLVENTGGYTTVLDEGVGIGTVSPAELCEVKYERQREKAYVNAIWTSEKREDRKKKLMELIKLEASDVCGNNKAELLNMISRYHEAFSLTEDERGETDLVQLEINTGQAEPKRTPLRRMPFAVREEVARQVKMLLDTRVITPSESPWSSPVVLMRKRTDPITSVWITET